MEIVAIAATVVSALNTYQQGQAAKAQYGVQARMATAEGERKQLQYQQRSNDVLRRRNQANSALAARAAAGGVNPFGGSPDIVAAANNTAAGREYSMLLADADAALRGGALQAQLYTMAGKEAARSATFSAVAKLGMGMAGSFGGTQAPAPIETRTV